MSGTTTINALRYATGSDAADANVMSSNLASDCDTRLIPRFTSAAARDAAITAPTNGMFAYTTSNDTLWYYKGSLSKWIWAAPKIAYVGITQAQSLANSTTLTNVTPLTVTVDTSASYIFEFWGMTLADPAADIKLNFTLPANTTYTVGNISTDTAGSSSWLAQHGTGSSFTTSSGWNGSSSDQCGYIRGYVSTTTAGTIQVQFAQFTSGANASWILAGSFLEVHQVG